MAQLRLFTAVDPPEEIIEALAGTVDRLRPLAKIAWSRPSNFHITTKFIGSWEEQRLAEVNAALRSLRGREPFSVRLAGINFFPHSLWAGVEGAGLASLAAATEEALSRIGVEVETRAYSPHLTLARIKERRDANALRREIAKLGAIEFGSFTADRFHLYASSRGAGGSVYTKLSEFPF